MQSLAGATLAIAVLAALGWMLGLRQLAGAWNHYIPISPSTTLAFLLLGAGLLSEARWDRPIRRVRRRWAAVTGGIPALLGALILMQYLTGFDSRVEWVLSRTEELAGGIPLGRMSPVTAATLVLQGSALLLLHVPFRRRQASLWAALCGLLVTVCGLTVLVGYAYGAPLLYGGTTIPVALPTAIGFLLLGSGITSLAVPRVPRLAPWSGRSTRGILVRAFLPAMLLFILVEGWISVNAEDLLNPALLHSLSVLAGCFLMVLLTGWTARRVGDTLDQAGEAVRTSEELFRCVFRNSAAGMVLVSPESRFLQVNESFCRMLGYGESELVGQSFQTITHPDDQGLGAHLLGQALSGETDTFHLEKRYLRKDGSVAWGLAVSTLIRDAQQRPLYFVTQVQDITDRKRAEAALRESRELLEAVLNSIPTRVFWKDRNSVYLGCNAPFARDAGFESPEDLVGKDDYVTSWRAQAELYRNDDRAVIEQGLVKSLYEEPQTTASGKQVFLLTSKLPLRDSYGAIVGVLGTYHDITDRRRAQEALRQSEETHRALVAGLPDIILRFDRDGRHLFVSDNAHEAFGLSSGQMIGKTGCELGLPEAHCRLWEAAIGTVFESRTQFETEFTIDRHQGPGIYNLRIVPEFDPAGSVRSVLAISRDITAHRRAEENYKNLFREMLDGFALHEIICDEAGRPVDYRFLAVNPSFENLTGLRATDIVGRTVREVLPGIEPKWIETYGDVALNGKSARFEDSAQSLGKHFEVRAFQPAAGQFACIFADVTEQRRAEQELRASERHSRMLARALQSANECVSITDLEDRILYVNAAFRQTYGYREDELIGQHITMVRSDRTPREIQDEIPLATRSGQWTGELWNRAKDGREFPIMLTTSVICDESGEAIGYVGIARDITGNRRSEEERARLQAQLHQVQKTESIGRLAGGIAHDFNNLLTVINGYSQLLLSRLTDRDPMRDTISAILGAGQRAAALTGQLLAFSRKQVLEPRRLDINRVVEGMRPMLERLVGEDIEVVVAATDESAIVSADPHQLEQVIMNLVVNARDAMPRGGKLVLETATVEWDHHYQRSHPEARVGRYARLAVSDTGMGLDPEVKSRIFEPFFTTKALGAGTGLGLSMVQGIVAQSGGYIEVYSELGRGSTFKIYLPAVHHAAADASVPPKGEALEVRGRETVLVVEDQADVRNYAASALKAYGYRVFAASNAREAVIVAEKEAIDLLLTDVVMPHVSGRALEQMLARIQPGINVLFMSGYTDNVIAHHGVLEEGANFIQKPFSPEELARKVRVVLQSQATATRQDCILVVDDDAEVRGFLRDVLMEAGYQVLEAADGTVALQTARTGQADLLLTDLVMPEKEGLDVIQTLRREMPGMGIIAISGAFHGEFLKTARLLGADIVLSKPLSPDLLLANVEDVLKSRRQAPLL